MELHRVYGVQEIYSMKNNISITMDQKLSEKLKTSAEEKSSIFIEHLIAEDLKLNLT